MARFIPAAERIEKAHKLIQKAREFPVPPDAGRYDLHYIGEIKALLREARDLVKFITYRPGASPEMKAEVAEIFQECDRVDQELLRGKL